MQFQLYTFPMFELQACFVKDYILGKIKIPCKGKRTKNIKEWLDRCEKATNRYEATDFQRDYTKYLIQVNFILVVTFKP